MSNVLLEASEMGRPILASNVPGCIETFEESVTGFGFEPKNSSDLLSVLERFVKLPYPVREAMGVKAREKMIQEFNRENITAAYLNLVKNIYPNK
jgi:galacturonosyltransferase